MGAAAFSGDTGGVQEGLNTLEQFRVHEGLVAAGVLGALVGDDAEVVPVAEHGGQLGVRHRSGGVAAGSGP